MALQYKLITFDINLALQKICLKLEVEMKIISSFFFVLSCRLSQTLFRRVRLSNSYRDVFTKDHRQNPHVYLLRYTFNIVSVIMLFFEMLFGQNGIENRSILKENHSQTVLLREGAPVRFPENIIYKDEELADQISIANPVLSKQNQAVIQDQDQFHSVSGPYGGTVRSIAVDSRGWLFIATDGEVYRSKDNGLHWDTHPFPSQFHNFVEPVTILAPDIVAVVADRNNFISRDGGDSWDYLGDFHGFAIDSSGVIYAGTEYSGVKISKDTAKSWQQFALPGRNIYQVVLCGAGKFACPGDSGIFYSADEGATWILRSNETHGYIRNLVSDRSGHLYGLRNTTGYPHFAISEDFGKTWQDITLPVSEDIYRMYLDNDGSIQIVTSSKILISNDRGKTWSMYPFFALTVGYDASGNLLAGNFDGIFRFDSTNGEWNAINEGIHARRIETITVTPSGAVLVLSLGTYFRSTDSGNSWKIIDLGSNAHVNTYPPVLVSSQGGIFIPAYFNDGDEFGLIRSSDDGLTWKKLPILSNHYSIEGLAEGISGDILVATYYGEIFRSIDNGGTWEKVFSDYDHSEIRCIATDKSGNYFASKDSTILISRNGINWDSNTLKRGYVQRELFSIDSQDEIFISSYSYGVYHSYDHGRSWKHMHSGLYDDFILSNATDDSGNVVLGSGSGIFRLADFSDSWYHFGYGFPQTFTTAMTISPQGYLYAGTQDFGIYRSDNPLGERSPAIRPPVVEPVSGCNQ